MSDFCPNCSNEIFKSDKFCGYCGFSLKTQDTNHNATQQELKVSHIRFKLGMVYMKKKEFAKAIEMFEKVEKENPANTEVIELLNKAREQYQLSIENEMVED